MKQILAALLLCLPVVSEALPLRVPTDGAVMTTIKTFRPEETLAVMELLIKWESEEKPEIWLQIDTNGGNIENGMALIKLIEALKTPIVCVVDHKAYSFGFVLLQACNERVMTKRSILMMHGAVAAGIDYSVNAEDLREMADNLEVASDALMHFSLAKLNMTEAEFKEKVKGGKDWWLDYGLAVKYGAVDAYAEPRKLPPVTFPKIVTKFKLPFELDE